MKKCLQFSYPKKYGESEWPSVMANSEEFKIEKRKEINNNTHTHRTDV